MNKKLMRLHLPMDTVLAKAISHGSWENDEEAKRKERRRPKCQSFFLGQRPDGLLKSLVVSESCNNAIPTHRQTQRLKRAILGPFIGAREMGEPSLVLIRLS
jgi:hypothetical protein